MFENKATYIKTNSYVLKLNPEAKDAYYSLHVQFNKALRIYDDEVTSMEENYYKRKAQFEAELHATVEEIRVIEETYKILKANMQDFAKQQKNYYYELLRKGIDVRSEGLTWVIKKLIELNAFLDTNHFPKFLDKTEIDYLLDIAHKETDILYLSMILKALKKTQKTKRNIIGEEIFNTTSTTFRQSKMEFDLKNLHMYERKKFCERMMKLYTNISGSEQYTNLSHQMRLEDDNIENIMADLMPRIKSPDFIDSNVKFYIKIVRRGRQSVI
jgi:hypothetical protein